MAVKKKAPAKRRAPAKRKPVAKKPPAKRKPKAPAVLVVPAGSTVGLEVMAVLAGKGAVGTPLGAMAIELAVAVDKCRSADGGSNMLPALTRELRLTLESVDAADQSGDLDTRFAELVAQLGKPS